MVPSFSHSQIPSFSHSQIPSFSNSYSHFLFVFLFIHSREPWPYQINFNFSFTRAPSFLLPFCCYAFTLSTIHTLHHNSHSPPQFTLILSSPLFTPHSPFHSLTFSLTLHNSICSRNFLYQFLFFLEKFIYK